MAYLSSVPPMARLLGGLGLLPFIGSGLAVWVSGLGDLRFALPIMCIAYAALIASFLGGVRWGAAMQNAHADSQPRHLVMSIMPSLVAFVAFMLPLSLGFIVLIILYIAQAALDVLAADADELMAWYKPLRLVLSIVACLAMLSMLNSRAGALTGAPTIPMTIPTTGGGPYRRSGNNRRAAIGATRVSPSKTAA